MDIINWKEELKKEVIATIDDLNVCSKTMIMLTGLSRTGKTVTCLNFMNSAILNHKMVAYFDTDEKSIITRPEPNYFNMFYSQNPELYDQYFKYFRDFDTTTIYESLDKIKPNLVIIDSIYPPFEKMSEVGMTRAYLIKQFLIKVRDYIWKNNIGFILTTPIKRIPIDGKLENVSLGGVGVTYLSDVKITIDFPDNPEQANEWRKFVVDNKYEYYFKINEKGELILWKKK